MKVTMQQGGLVSQNAKQELESKKNPMNLKDFVELRMPEIQKVLPSVISAQQFLRLTLNAIQNTKHLSECSVSSFYASLMQCAQLGLTPNVNGEAHLIPFKNNKKGYYECQFVIGYKGLMKLARRSGEIASIDAQTVYENDEFVLEYGFEPKLIHKPYLKGERGKPTGFYAAVLLKDGGRTSYYMTAKEAEAYGKRYSKSYSMSDSPWKTDFESMAKKSCLRQALKYAPTSTDVESALRTDENVLEYKKTDENGGFGDGFIEVEEEPEVREDSAENTVETGATTDKTDSANGTDLKADADGVIIGDSAKVVPEAIQPVQQTIE